MAERGDSGGAAEGAAGDAALAALIAAARPHFRTATARVAETLRRAILDGTLPGGTVLRQEELAAQFAVSRMPVRDALKQLEAQALVSIVPNRGAVVSELSAQDAADIMGLRALVEPEAIALSVPNLTAADLAAAAAALADLEAATDPARMGELNRRFHMSLYARAGRPRLLALIGALFAETDAVLRFQLAALGAGEMGAQAHAAMLAAARAGDAAGAARLVRAHIGEAAARLVAFLGERGPQSGRTGD
ncbi:GntR family transcriptional regulator [Pseudoxanthobacter sp.]|uniref:GntR family transcriptional regulator n=1 Tax=Pseudoxanthobacter sp. TaxID=1925742 RepID=UPI002FDFFCD8